MEYEERKEKLYFVKFKVLASDEFITVATARPETISADVAIAIYPKHPKFAKFVGQKAINPFTNAKMDIIEDKRIDKAFGTGALKVTPGHAPLDYEIGKDHNLPIPPLHSPPPFKKLSRSIASHTSSTSENNVCWARKESGRRK